MTKETPLSDEALRAWPEFTAAVHRRLDRGRQDYGDSSLTSPILDTLEELAQELLDQAGWAFINWIKLQERISDLQSVRGRRDAAGALPLGV